MKYLKSYENIDGVTFKEWLERNPRDIDFTGWINCVDSNLIDLDGIEEFKNLIHLDCRNNQLIELPDLSNLTKLRILNVERNKLKRLPDLSNNIQLEVIDCESNRLEELPDLSKLNKLDTLYCGYNKLKELPDIISLIELDILTRLGCYGNGLPYNDLDEYIEWHKKEYPWIYDAKKYNL
jgi:Leucine-rich repeat (LRR) protein